MCRDGRSDGVAGESCIAGLDAGRVDTYKRRTGRSVPGRCGACCGARTQGGTGDTGSAPRSVNELYGGAKSPAAAGTAAAGAASTTGGAAASAAAKPAPKAEPVVSREDEDVIDDDDDDIESKEGGWFSRLREKARRAFDEAFKNPDESDDGDDY